MRDAPPSLITGPTLVYDSSRRRGGSFVCSQCHTDFHTDDPVVAFQLFSARKHKCTSKPKAGMKRTGLGQPILT
jgi:hypothetical protein